MEREGAAPAPTAAAALTSQSSLPPSLSPSLPPSPHLGQGGKGAGVREDGVGKVETRRLNPNAQHAEHGNAA